jgi:hypothetical protein
MSVEEELPLTRIIRRDERARVPVLVSRGEVDRIGGVDRVSMPNRRRFFQVDQRGALLQVFLNHC